MLGVMVLSVMIVGCHIQSHYLFHYRLHCKVFHLCLSGQYNVITHLLREQSV